MTAQTFEYVTYDKATGIFNYPKSDRQIGFIENTGGGECTNVLYGYGKGTFWIVDPHHVTQYRVIKKLIKTISISFGGLSSCAMDGRGDLAVGILYGTNGGGVLVYKNASGAGKLYSTGLGQAYSLGYDPGGDLFVDGFVNNDKFELAELASGSTTFHTVTVSNKVRFPGSVQWDGTYLDVHQAASAMYQYAGSGTKAMLKGTVLLSGSSDCAQTWIATGVVFCADAGNNAAYAFDYPAGGSPIATFTSNFNLPLGVVATQK